MLEVSQAEKREIMDSFRDSRAPADRKSLKKALSEISKILKDAVDEIEESSKKENLTFTETAGIMRKYLNRIIPILNAIYLNSFGKLIRAYQTLLYSDAVDEFGYDPKFEEFVKPLFKFLYEKWWRVEVEGGENLPSKGRVLIVSNHSGMLPFDGAMIKYYFREIHPSHRDIRPLAENFVYYLPFIGAFMNRVGGVRACQENAEILLRRDEAVIVFPEGVKGIVKHFSKRYQLQRFGRAGFVKLAIRTRSPILPTAVVGAEEIFPIIAKFDALGKLFHLPTLPIPLNLFLLGPFFWIPFPTKWRIKFGKLITKTAELPPEAENDDILINQISLEVRLIIEDMLHELLSKRKSIWTG